MTYIEAKGCLREFVEQDLKILSSPTGGLTLVHVLYAEHISQLPPKRKVMKCVWVNHYGPSPIPYSVKGLENAVLRVG